MKYNFGPNHPFKHGERGMLAQPYISWLGYNSVCGFAFDLSLCCCWAIAKLNKADIKLTQGSLPIWGYNTIWGCLTRWSSLTIWGCLTKLVSHTYEAALTHEGPSPSDMEIVGHPVILTDRKFLNLQTYLWDSSLLRRFLLKGCVQTYDFCFMIWEAGCHKVM